MMLRPAVVALVGVLAALCTAGCGTSVYRPAQTAGFELEPVGEINDEDVRKAFDARPQLPARISVAYYTFDDEYAEAIETMLATVPVVSSTYRIPTLLVTGKRRFDEPVWGAPPAPPLSIKKLRLMAARAHADVLLVFDYGYRVAYSPNGLVAFAVAIVPMFLLPLQDVTAESYLDTYAIDTRNGYLYGHVSATRDAEEDYLFIYSDRGQELADGQRDELVAESRRLLVELLTRAQTAARPAGSGDRGGLEGQRPAPSTEPPGRAALLISLEPDGGLVVAGQRFDSLQQAEARIGELVGGRSAEAIVRAHPGVAYERAAELIELLRSMRVRSVTLEKAQPERVDSQSAEESVPDGGPPRLPNPASGNPSRVTPPPLPSSPGAPTPVSPLPGVR